MASQILSSQPQPHRGLIAPRIGHSAPRSVGRGCCVEMKNRALSRAGGDEELAFLESVFFEKLVFASALCSFIEPFHYTISIGLIRGSVSFQPCGFAVSFALSYMLTDYDGVVFWEVSPSAARRCHHNETRRAAGMAPAAWLAFLPALGGLDQADTSSSERVLQSGLRWLCFRCRRIRAAVR